MQITNCFLIVSLFIVAIQGQGSEPSTGDNQVFTCGDKNDQTQQYQRGDQIYFCVQYVVSTSSTIRMAYLLNVDEYTAVQAYGAFTQLGSNSMISIAAQAGGYNSTSLVPYIVNSTIVYPIFNVVVYMTQGTITGIIWNNVCFTSTSCGTFLDSSQVTQQNEYVDPTNSCQNNQSCDPQVYVAYTGTDTNGQQLTSASYSMPRYRQFSTSSVFNNALNQIQATV